MKINMTISTCTFSTVVQTLEEQLAEAAETLIYAACPEQRSVALRQCSEITAALNDVGENHCEVRG